MRHIHLDPVGGLAGDMFIAAILDALPDLGQSMRAVVEPVARVRITLAEFSDGTLTGLRFRADCGAGHAHGQHAHTDWTAIRARILDASLDESVKTHAIGIFAALAEAEARVHGVRPEQVTFHEIGAADSIADIVGAAWLVAALAPATWSCAPVPIGSGRVATAHGILPVPAPATALLLEGMATIDDGIPGERVTPTGAAILRHLRAHAPGEPGRARILRRSGTGFGTRRLPGISNCLRVLVLEDITSGEESL